MKGRGRKIYQKRSWDSELLGGGGRYTISIITLGACTPAFPAYSCLASFKTDFTSPTSTSLHLNNTDGSFSLSKLWKSGETNSDSVCPISRTNKKPSHIEVH